MCLDLVKKLTEEPLTGEAWVKAIKIPVEEKLGKGICPRPMG